MTSKRKNENAHQRGEELEAELSRDDDEEESTPVFGMKKADEAVLSQRKIVKVDRSRFKRTDTPTAGSDTTPRPNMFTSLSFGSVKTTANPPPKIGVNVSTKSSTIGLGFDTSKSTSILPEKPSRMKAAAPDVSGLFKSVPRKVEGYEERMAKLNTKFCKWLERQKAEHPSAIWREGMRDYIKYAEQIEEQFGTQTHTQTRANDEEPRFVPEPDTSEDKDLASKSVPAKPVFGFPKPTPNPNPTLIPNPNPNPKPPFGFVTTPKPTLNSNPNPNPNHNPNPKSSFAFGTSNSNPTPNPFALGGLKKTDEGQNPNPTPSAIPDANPNPNPNPNRGPATETAPKFSFSYKQPSATNPNPNPTPTSNPKTSFGFGGFSKPSVGGFKLGAGNPNPNPNVNTNTNGSDEEGDDEGQPIEEPEPVLKDESDTDEQLYSTDCILYKCTEDGWSSRGKGTFRLTRDPSSSKAPRILIRNTLGKIMLNCYLFKGQKFDKMKDKWVKFSATDEEGKLVLMSVKLKSPDDQQAAIQVLSQHIPA